MKDHFRKAQMHQGFFIKNAGSGKAHSLVLMLSGCGCTGTACAVDGRQRGCIR